MPLLLVRHAKAGNRQDWPGDDRFRPLSPAGARQAEELARRLLPYGPVRVLSSSYVRCRETVQPLAALAGVTVEDLPELEEGRSKDTISLIRKLAIDADGSGRAFVLCSHGDVIPEVLDHFALEDDLDLGPAPRCAKGSTWVLEADGTRMVTACYLTSHEGSPSRSGR